MSDPVFVFGSNLAGRHGKGAALWAREHRGAIYGQGVGYQGNSYAIPTKGVSPNPRAPMPILPLYEIDWHVHRFLEFARAHPELTFQLTPIGCGYAGYSPADIAPMFAGAPPNVTMPPEFISVLCAAGREDT